MKSKLQSRKFIMSIALIVFALAAIPLEWGTFVEATDFIKWVLGIYLVTNTSQNIGLRIRQTNEVKQ